MHFLQEQVAAPLQNCSDLDKLCQRQKKITKCIRISARSLQCNMTSFRQIINQIWMILSLGEESSLKIPSRFGGHYKHTHRLTDILLLQTNDDVKEFLSNFLTLGFLSVLYKNLSLQFMISLYNRRESFSDTFKQPKFFFGYRAYLLIYFDEMLYSDGSLY